MATVEIDGGLVDQHIGIAPPAPEQVLKDLTTLMPSILPRSVQPLTRELDRRPEDGQEYDANGLNARLLRCAGVVQGEEIERIFVEVNTRNQGSFTVEAIDPSTATEVFLHPYAHKAVIEERRESLRQIRATREAIESLPTAA